MAGDWFAMDCNFSGRPEVHRIATATGLDRQLVVGRFVDWFRWIDSDCTEHPTVKGWGLFPGITAADIARECGGDAEYWRVVSQSAPEWLKFDSRGACVPGYESRFSKSAKKRLEDAERKRNERLAAKDRAAASGDDPSTESTDRSLPPTKPKPSRKGFAWSKVTAEILAYPSKVVEWCEMAAGDRTVKVKNNAEWHVALIAAAHMSMKADNPAAYFITLVRDKELKTITPEALTHARAQYHSLREMIDQVRAARERNIASRIAATEEPAPLGAVLPMLKRG